MLFLTCASTRLEYDKRRVWNITGNLKHTQNSAWGHISGKGLKGQYLTYKFEIFKMQEHESVEDMFTRFTIIANEINDLVENIQHIKGLRRF